MSSLLAEKLTELHNAGVAQPILDRLKTHIETTEPSGLINISPYRMADEWNLPRREVLDAFLYGTRFGLFDLEWHVKCPSCKGATEKSKELMLLKPKSHCEYCRIDIQAAFDEAVEVVFQVNPNVRELETPILWDDFIAYWKLFEEVARFRVDPHASGAINITFEPATYYLMEGTHRSVEALTFEPDLKTETREITVHCGPEGMEYVFPKFYEAGTYTLKIQNDMDEPALFLLQQQQVYPWISGAQIASNQSFRDLFSSELISADESFSVKNLVFVFTDIKGSTALYERIGDSQAYLIVKRHFQILTDTVRQHNGAVVKTIGDAIMATFPISTDAFQAVLEMQRAFDQFNSTGEIAPHEIIIKVGLHRGPCIAVTSNDRLDYFGRTVNIAARIQGLSTGHDVMMSKLFYDEPAITQLVEASGWHVSFSQAELKGIDRLYDVVHLTEPGK